MPPKRRATADDNNFDDRDAVDDSVSNVLLIRVDRIISGAEKCARPADTIADLVQSPNCIGRDGTQRRTRRSDAEFLNTAVDAASGETILDAVAYFFASSDTSKKGRDAALAIFQRLLQLGAEPILIARGSGLSPLARACMMRADIIDTRLIGAILDHIEGDDSSDDDDDDGDNDNDGTQQSDDTDDDVVCVVNVSPRRKPAAKKKASKKQQKQVSSSSSSSSSDDEDVLIFGGSARKSAAADAAAVLPLREPVNRPCTSTGLTPALLCAQHGHLSHLRYLIQQRNADPLVVGAVGAQSLIHMAALGGNLQCLQFAVSACGYDPVPPPPAAKTKRGAAASRSASPAPPPAAGSASALDAVRCVRGGTPLHYAAEHRDGARAAAVIDYLVVEHRCDVDARTHGGATPLLLATEANALGAAECLLRRHGADAAAAANDRTTAVHVALRFGYFGILRLLREAGARIPALSLPAKERPPAKPKSAKKAPAKKKAGKKSGSKKAPRSKKGGDSDDGDSSSSSSSGDESDGDADADDDDAIIMSAAEIERGQQITARFLRREAREKARSAAAAAAATGAATAAVKTVDAPASVADAADGAAAAAPKIAAPAPKKAAAKRAPNKKASPAGKKAKKARRKRASSSSSSSSSAEEEDSSSSSASSEEEDGSSDDNDDDDVPLLVGSTAFKSAMNSRR